MVVDEHGNPTKVQAAKPVGHGFDEKAIDAVKQYRFKPATTQGKPVPVQVNVEVTFKIRPG